MSLQDRKKHSALVLNVPTKLSHSFVIQQLNSSIIFFSLLMYSSYILKYNIYSQYGVVSVPSYLLFNFIMFYLYWSR